MKRLLRRYTLLLALVAAAFVWVALLSIPFGQLGPARAADGATGRFTLLDDKAFPTIAAYAALQDGSGALLGGLNEGDFTLTEDGIPVDFTLTPAGEQALSAMLVIDRSGSMDDEDKMEGAIDAAQTFIDLLRPARDTLGIMMFGDDITTLLPAERLATEADRRAASQLLAPIYPGGGTRLNDAIIEAVDRMQGTTGRRVIIALTDGMSDGDMSSAADSIERATEAGIPVYTIGLGSDVDDNQLERIADRTDGAYFFAPDATELATLYANLAEALQNEYSFTYTSPTPRLDGTRRALELGVERAGGSFTVGDDYAVGGVLVSQRSPWLLLALGGPLVLLLLVPPLFNLRRRSAPTLPGGEGVPIPVGVAAEPVGAKPAAEPVTRHPYRTPLDTPPATGAAPAPRRSFTVMLRNERTTIGSEAGNDVVLPGLAAHHAAIMQQDGRWVVTSAGGDVVVSYNGDAGAERPIVGTNAIKHGSVIRLGSTRTVFQSKDHPELVIEG